MKVKIEKDNTRSAPQLLTLADEMELNRTNLWVLNTSENASESGKGDVFVGVVWNNQTIASMIPKTWLPYNLAEDAPRKAFLESASFVKAIKSSILQLVSDEYAKKLMNQEGAEEEQRRLLEVKEQVRTATRTKGIVTEVVDRDKEGATRTFDIGDLEETQGVNASFQAFANQLNEKSEKEAVNELRARGKLNEKQAKFLITALKHKKIVAWLKGQLDE